MTSPTEPARPNASDDLSYHEVTREQLIQFQTDAYNGGDSIAVDVAAECVRLMGLARFYRKQRDDLRAVESSDAEKLRAEAVFLRQCLDADNAALVRVRSDVEKSREALRRIDAIKNYDNDASAFVAAEVMRTIARAAVSESVSSPAKDAT